MGDDHRDIPTGSGADAGLLQVTWVGAAEGARTALFTARGKDHDMSAGQLRALAAACLAAAEALEAGEVGRE